MRTQARSRWWSNRRTTSSGGRRRSEDADLLECGCVGFRDSPVFPLDAGQQGRLADVRAPDEGDARAVQALHGLGLRVEGEGGRRARVREARGMGGFVTLRYSGAMELDALVAEGRDHLELAA